MSLRFTRKVTFLLSQAPRCCIFPSVGSTCIGKFLSTSVFRNLNACSLRTTDSILSTAQGIKEVQPLPLLRVTNSTVMTEKVSTSDSEDNIH